jgi:hypothetical protein
MYWFFQVIEKKPDIKPTELPPKPDGESQMQPNSDVCYLKWMQKIDIFFFSFNILVYSNGVGYRCRTTQYAHKSVCILCSLIVNKRIWFFRVPRTPLISTQWLIIITAIIIIAVICLVIIIVPIAVIVPAQSSGIVLLARQESANRFLWMTDRKEDSLTLL